MEYQILRLQPLERYDISKANYHDVFSAENSIDC
jgi:hypothetical protein